MSIVNQKDTVSELFLSRDQRLSNHLGGQDAEDFARTLANDPSLRQSHVENTLRTSRTSRSSRESIEKDKSSLLENAEFSDEQPESIVPDMWSWDYIGLYSQYASVGLLYGSTGTLMPFCVYHFEGESNVCANARNIVTFAWSFKIFFALMADSFRPFGLRRRPWMIFGWAGALLILLFLAIFADTMSVTGWLVSLMLSQCCLMISDVPADGYCVELGQLEPIEQRGQILATAQRIRFTFCILAGAIQTFLLNGPSVSPPDCPINFENCWSWGLTINQYYGLLFAIIFVLSIPLLWLKELDPSKIPRHTFSHFIEGIWDTLQNLTTFYLLIFVIGIFCLSNFTNNANVNLQYYVIELTNFQSGIDTITTYASLVVAIWIFQKYLINRNWRHTQYFSTLLSALIGLIWIAPYYDSAGTMDPWFTIFIELDTAFASGLSQVLYSMAVIELAKVGQEATTYELIVTVGNAAITANGVVSTQLLYPMKAVACTDSNCASDTVDVNSVDSYNDSDGPARFTNYTLLLTGISCVASLIFTRFLPASKEECQEWKQKGEEMGQSTTRAKIALFLTVCTVSYGLTAAILLLNTSTSCLSFIGGSGC